MKNFTALKANNNAASPLREMEMQREMEREMQKSNTTGADKAGAIGRPVI